MDWCNDCQSVHFPGACRRPQTYTPQQQPHNWFFPAGFTYAPGLVRGPLSLDAYEKTEDPNVRLCRPCQSGDRVAGHIHSCDGAPCECPLCRRDELGFMDVVEEMSEDWDLRDKEDSWGFQR